MPFPVQCAKGKGTCKVHLYEFRILIGTRGTQSQRHIEHGLVEKISHPSLSVVFNDAPLRGHA